MTQIVLKSTIDVHYRDHMGDDKRIVEAMLASTKGLDAEEASHERVDGRIGFLAKNRHGTPFEATTLQLVVDAPIKVWREWHRHRIGFSYNEESGRYKQLRPVFWLPPPHRPMMRPEGFRSAYPDFDVATEEEYAFLKGELEQGYQSEYDRYERLLEKGFDRGLARDCLGVGIFSTCYVTANVRAFLHWMELRTKHPQARRPSKPLWEIAEAGRQVEEIVSRLWPIAYAKWMENGRMAP